MGVNDKALTEDLRIKAHAHCAFMQIAIDDLRVRRKRLGAYIEITQRLHTQSAEVATAVHCPDWGVVGGKTAILERAFLLVLGHGGKS